MSNVQTVSIDPIRSIAHGSITNSYVAVGTAFTHPCRLICITNDTDGGMLFSTDASTDMLYLPAGTFKLFDLNTNRFKREQYWVFPVGTQFYVKYSAAPTKNSVYIEVLWGQ